MKITLRPKGVSGSGSDVVLADGADRADDNVRGPARAEISVSIAAQPSTGIGAASTTFYSRDNRAGSYSFNASRRFASVEACSRFILLHGSECPAEGTLIFDFGDAGLLVLLLGVVIRQIGPMQQTGAHVSTRYACQYSSAVESAEEDVQDVIDGSDPEIVVRKINCGADAAVSDWQADSFDYGGVANYYDPAAVENAGAVPQDVYKRYCAINYSATNKIQYSIPLAAGSYNVRLHFCAHGAVNYIQSIYIDDAQKAENLNVATEAGGTLKALVKTYAVTHSTGNLVLKIYPAISSYCQICGIEIVQA